MMDDTLKRAMLLDFYGELLTKKQHDYFDLHYNEDLSLHEIAEQNEVSRQAVWDIIRRAEQVLQKAEDKIGLIARRARQMEKLEALEALLLEISHNSEGETKKLCEKAKSIVRELED